MHNRKKKRTLTFSLSKIHSISAVLNASSPTTTLTSCLALASVPSVPVPPLLILFVTLPVLARSLATLLLLAIILSSLAISLHKSLSTLRPLSYGFRLSGLSRLLNLRFLIGGCNFARLALNFISSLRVSVATTLTKLPCFLRLLLLLWLGLWLLWSLSRSALRFLLFTLAFLLTNTVPVLAVLFSFCSFSSLFPCLRSILLFPITTSIHSSDC